MADEIMLATLMSLGFDQDPATAALLSCNNSSVDEAVAILVTSIDDNPPAVEAPVPDAVPKPTPTPPTIDTNILPNISDDTDDGTSPAAEVTPSSNTSRGSHNKGKQKKGKKAKTPRTPDTPDTPDSDSSLSYSDDDEFIVISGSDCSVSGDGNMFAMEKAAGPKIDTATILTRNELVEKMDSDLGRINASSGLDPAVGRALLAGFRYDVQRVLDTYFEDPDRAFDTADITAPPEEAVDDGEEAPFMCMICGSDDLAAAATTILDCGHRFCTECWREHLRVQIRDGNVVKLTCMGWKCQNVVPDYVVSALVAPDTEDKYRRFAVKLYVDGNPRFKFCPGRECSNVVTTDAKIARCYCGFVSCTVCSAESHYPASCDLLKEWEKKCNDDSETANWLAANTKSCPKCHNAIEKNGGCNHMTCRTTAGGCGHEFCWICSGDWRGHSACNRYDEDKKTSEISDQRALLERYLHYYNRWQAHMDSRKLEAGLRERSVTNMMELREAAMDNPELFTLQSDVQFIEEGTDRLIECRRTLQYTYVVGFYLEKGAEKSLFEYLQENLETTTEQLSEALEQDVLDMDKQQIEALTILCGQRLVHLIEGCEEGLTNNADDMRVTSFAGILDSPRTGGSTSGGSGGGWGFF